MIRICLNVGPPDFNVDKEFYRETNPEAFYLSEKNLALNKFNYLFIIPNFVGFSKPLFHNKNGNKQNKALDPCGPSKNAPVGIRLQSDGKLPGIFRTKVQLSGNVSFLSYDCFVADIIQPGQ